MSHTETIRWFDLLREFFGVNLSTDRAVTWLRLMNEPDALSDVTETELCNVIRWVRKKREGDETRKTPNLEMIIGWVKWSRKERSASRRGYNDNDSGFLGLVKSAMLKADNNDDRWNIMCDPNLYGVNVTRTTTSKECDSLLVWARTRWPDIAEPMRKPILYAAIGKNVSGDFTTMEQRKAQYYQSIRG